MKTYGEAVIYLHILTLTLDGGECSESQALSAEKSPHYPLDRRLYGFKNRDESSSEEKYRSPCCESNFDRSLRSFFLLLVRWD